MFKKLLSIVICLALVFCIPVFASADVGDNNYDESEPNSSTSYAKRMYADSTVSGTLYDVDLDYFKFVLSSSSKVTLLVQSTSSRIYACINDAYDDVICVGSSSYNNGYYYDTISKTLPAGTYYVCLLNNERYYSTSYLFYFDYSSTSTHTHSYSSTVIEPTCTSQGYTKYTCSCGDSYKSNYTSAKGHSYTSTIVEPTCSSQGYTKETCSSCGKVNKSNYTPAKGHSLTVTEYVEATCSQDGYKTTECDKCGFITSEVIAKKGHEETEIASTDATYFTSGSKTYSCSICNETWSVKFAKLKLKAPKFNLTGAKKKFTVKYTKVTGATGFQVRYKLGNGKWKTVNFDTKKSASRIVKNLKKGNYKVQIRAYVKQGSKKAYSNWTSTKTVKVK